MTSETIRLTSEDFPALAREFAKAFYRSKAWERTREAYFRASRGLCEKCLTKGFVTPGAIVHHKEHLTPENISDPSVSLAFENLELVCRKCHAEEHPEIYGEPKRPQRVAFDGDGNVLRLEGISF